MTRSSFKAELVRFLVDCLPIFEGIGGIVDGLGEEAETTISSPKAELACLSPAATDAVAFFADKGGVELGLTPFDTAFATRFAEVKLVLSPAGELVKSSTVTELVRSFDLLA